jgi:hypothetical protein
VLVTEVARLGNGLSGASGLWCQSDAEGVFRVSGVLPGLLNVFASKPGYATIGHLGILVQDGRIASDIVIQLPPAAVLRGRVVDEDSNAPIKGAQILAIAKEWRDPVRRETSTNSEGEFELDGLLEEQYGVLARRSGWSPTTIQWDGTEAEIALRLRRNCSIGGKVVDAVTGCSMEYFTVRIGHADGTTMRELGRKCDFQNTDGNFTIEDMEPGAYVVEVWAPGYAFTTLGPVVLDRRRDPSEVAVGLRRGATVSGRIVRRDGTAVATGIVRVAKELWVHDYFWEQTNPSSFRRLRSDAEGWFAAQNVAAGEYHISVTDPASGKQIELVVDVPVSGMLDLGSIVMPIEGEKR